MIFFSRRREVISKLTDVSVAPWWSARRYGALRLPIMMCLSALAMRCVPGAPKDSPSTKHLAKPRWIH